MPRVGDLYPDKFMKAHHLEEMDPEAEHYVFKIRSTDVTEYEDGKKQLVLRFFETNLELGLNKGNATMLEKIFESDESDDWVGKKIALHVEVVRNSFAPSGQGPAIRVSDKATRKANKVKPEKTPDVIPGALGRLAGKPAEPLTQAEADIPENETPF